MTLAFVHIEKAAGMSVHKILKQTFGSRYLVVEAPSGRDGTGYVFDSDAYKRVRFLYPNLAGIGGHWIRPFSDLNHGLSQLSYWTIVRDPIKRTLSHYQYQIQIMGKEVPFEEWSQEKRYWNFQTKKICGTDDAAEAIGLISSSDFIGVGMLERFEESLILLDQWLGGNMIPAGDFRDNSAPSDNIKKELMRNPSILATIETMNVEDSKLYAAIRDKLFPAQIDAAEKAENGTLVDQRRTNRHFQLTCRERVSDLKRMFLYKPLRKLQG